MAVFVSALAIGLASLLMGAAICCRREWTWTAPATGFATLVLITVLAVRLPGHGATAAAAAGVALATAAVVVARARPSLRPLLPGLPVAVLVLALCALPYLANGRVGELGTSTLDDIWFHMRQADVLRDEGTSRQVLADGYPIGPHAVVAALAEGTGIGVSPAFSGLTLAAPVLLALVALAGVGAGPLLLRAAAAALVGVTYLVVAYVAEGAFKEPLLAVLFLGFALSVREALAARRLEPGHAAPLMITAAAGVAVFGLAAFLWPAALAGWLALIELGPRARSLKRPSAGVLAGAAAAMAALLGALALAAVASGFFDTGPGRFVTDNGVGGNFVGQLSPFEAFGIWPRPDFRLGTGGKWWLEAGAVLATALALAGVVRYRRDRALLAAVLAVVTVYAVARPTTLAYFSGKALAVAAPVIALVTVRYLLELVRPGGRRGLPARVAAASAAVAFGMLALYSSALALRAAHVRPHERGGDLGEFRSLLDGAGVLYLARDAFAGWELRGSPLAGFQPGGGPGLTVLEPVPAKTEPVPPTAVDVDSPGPGGLDRSAYVITPRTAYASVVPPDLTPIGRTRWSVLWKRDGASPERRVLDEGDAPGAVLDCRTPGGRALSRSGGVAYVRPRPVVGAIHSWRQPGGAPAGGPGATVSGKPLVQTLALGPGAWEVALRYFSDMPLEVLLGDSRHELPAYITDSASFAAVGRVRGSGGPVRVEVRPPERRRLDVVRTVLLGELVAVRVDRRGGELPLRRACGRYVDWYSTDG